ncbi:unnamed protein product [Rangifer tarandus platyrhynchus]|uniref:Uncharacterized protein n=1 Tax=Rangifer tarandus platyrhynchus TaxID=3082113 RepID=A0AC59YPE8_RANTA
MDHGDAPGKREARGPRALTLELPSEPGTLPQLCPISPISAHSLTMGSPQGQHAEADRTEPVACAEVLAPGYSVVPG